MRSCSRRCALGGHAPRLCRDAGAQAQEVTLSVAISMKDAVEELGRGFMASRPGVTLRYNFGSSGELQKQIEAGAPVDLFISAAQRQMDELEQKELDRQHHPPRLRAQRAHGHQAGGFDARHRASRPICSTRGSRRSSSATRRRCRSASTPRRACKTLGLWDGLQPKLVSSPRTCARRSTTSRRGEVDAGFVYTTDAVDPRRPGEGGVSAGGRHVSAGAVPGGGGDGARSRRRWPRPSSISS